MGTANITREQAQQRSVVVTAIAYRVTVDVSGHGLEAPDATFRSHSELDFESTGGTTHLDIIADEIVSATLDDSPIDISDFDGYRLGLPELGEGVHTVAVEAICRYSNSGEGLHRFVDPADGKTYLYSQLETADARRMYATFEQPDQKATFELTVIAPANWTVLSNSAAVPGESIDDETSRWQFAPTPVMSTYITALVAGEYHRVTSEIVSRKGTLPASVCCRASVAKYLDAEAILLTTQRGFEVFEEAFDVDYAFDSYDQVFVPEFNFGAMENAGCVVFRDEYLFRSRVTAREIQARDNTILHELAHMWFGDLVTMRWWDDLWLNESFAEWASHFAAEEIANRYGTGENPWASFCNERKSWAYRQDQLSTTHPIAADMSDLERVEQNFDGITYAKGASVLKLLVSFVGKDKFLAGVGSYFTKHAYANTSLNDLLVELEAASGKDLSWFSQQWLETAGVNTLRADFDLDEHGNFTRFVIQQSAAEHLPTLRHHRLGIGLYHLGDDGLVRQHYTELDIEGETTEVPDLVGVNRGDLILLNDGDLTYAKIRLDEKSIETLVAHIHQLTDPLARAVVWSAFWDMARDAEIAPQQFVALAMQGVTTETDMTAATVALRQAETCSLPFVAPELREARNRKLVAGLAGLLKEAQAGSDLQRIIAKTLVRSARSEAALDLVRGWLDGEETPVGLSVDNELRWDIITTLARSGSADEALIEHELMNDRTSAGAERTAEAMTALPTTEHKAEAWRLATEDPSVPNETHRRICSSFMLYGQEELLVDYVDRYFECCEQISARQGGWESRGYAAIDAVTRGLFPAPLADEALIQRFEDWLASAEPSQQVQRVIREQLDEARRCLALQQRSTMAE